MLKMVDTLKIPWAVTVVVFIVAQTACVNHIANATKMTYIHWNTSNPLFRIDNTDHIIDVNKGNDKFEYDQVNIICPVYSSHSREKDTEKYIIYNVSKEEYDTCRISNPSPRIIAVCDHPYKLMYFTITFRSFTPQPGGLEFIPGQDYYFISTSSKDDLHRKIGGRCRTHNMKVVFKVCCDPASQPARDQANGHLLLTNGVATSREISSTTTKASWSPPSTPKSSRPTTITSSSSKTTSMFTTTTTTMLKTTSRKSTRDKSALGPKAAADTKKSSKKKSSAVELTRASGASSSLWRTWVFGLPFRVCLFSLWIATRLSSCS